MISCGDLHTLFIDAEGVVFSSGRNNSGQLGIGNTEDQNTFCPIKGVPSALQVAAANGGNHSAILDDQGDVWMFGQNHYCETGMVPRLTNILNPTKIKNLPRIIMVSCGSRHTIALDVTGCIWGTGDNSIGQISYSEAMILHKFTRIATPNEMGRVIKISCGSQHSIFQTETEELWGTGHNEYGELGLGIYGLVFEYSKVPFEAHCGVQDFACGISHTVVLDRNGGVWAAGSGYCGQLGVGALESSCRFTKLQIPPMMNIMYGGCCTMMKDLEGIIYACGENLDGQLGAGEECFLQPQALLHPPNVLHGCLSPCSVLLVDHEGRMWANGHNIYGQLGIGDNISRNTFAEVEGMKVNIGKTKEKRFLNTKRALS